MANELGRLATALAPTMAMVRASPRMPAMYSSG